MVRVIIPAHNEGAVIERSLAAVCRMEYPRYEVIVVNGSSGYVYNTVTQALTQITDPGYPGKLALQYWFFYPYNDAGNKHEGDWEHINVVVSARSEVTAPQTAAQVEALRRAFSASRSQRGGAPASRPSPPAPARAAASAAYMPAAPEPMTTTTESSLV
mgnify:CR=1 FL=1